jgi:hypothetical protein
MVSFIGLESFSRQIIPPRHFSTVSLLKYVLYLAYIALFYSIFSHNPGQPLPDRP